MLKLGKVSSETRGLPIPQNKIGFWGELDGSPLRDFV